MANLSVGNLLLSIGTTNQSGHGIVPPAEGGGPQPDTTDGADGFAPAPTT
jgi:hypothetical protein